MLVLGLRLIVGTAPAEDWGLVRRVGEEGLGFVEEVVIEGADGEDFGVRVVEDGAIVQEGGGGGEAFHACAVRRFRGGLGVRKGTG